MRRLVWPMTLVFIVFQVLDLVSDILVKPTDPGSARGWDIAASLTCLGWGYVVAGAYREDRK